MKNSVKIAYWDTEQGANPPSLIGQIRGTPTIKFIKPSPKKNKRGSFKKKIVSDYNGERNAKGMMAFAESNMPNFIERVNGQKDMDKFIAKADEYGLPKAVIISKKPSHVVKFMSTEYRRRMLVAEVRASKNNKDIIAKFGITDFPAAIILTDGEPIKMNKKMSFNRLNLFLGKHALSEPVYGKPKKEEKKEEKEEL